MSLWLKIIIGIWLYLSIGIGAVLMSQVIAAKLRDTDFDDWYWYLKIDPDEDSFGETVLGLMLLWPFLVLAILYFLIEHWLKKLFEKIWEEKEGEDDDEETY